MGSITNFLENELLDHLCLTNYTRPTTVYLALATADPTDAATGASMSEVANSGAYARVAITFGAAAARSISNSVAVAFTQATGSWGTVTHWAIVDSATYGAGNALAHGSLSTAKAVVNGNTPEFAIGEIEVEFLAGEIGTAVATTLLDFVFRNQAYLIVSNYIALCTATIADSDTGSTITEPSGNGYARQQVNANGGAAPDWELAAAGQVQNDDLIQWATATGSWGTIVAVAVVTASSGGDLLLYDNAMADQAVAVDDIAEFAANALTLQMS